MEIFSLYTKFYPGDCRVGDLTKRKQSGNSGKRPVEYTQTNISTEMKNEAEPRKVE